VLNIVKPSRPKARRKMLGLAVGEKSILIAELSVGTGGFAVTTASQPQVPRPFEATHLVEFVLPKGMTLQSGEALGTALFEFLKQSDISVRHVVIGIPAKWVVVKTKQVPPAEPPVIAESLRLQAEGDFSAALSDLVYDYAGQTSTAEARQVLLMATPKRYIDQVLAVARAARLEVVAVTPSAASLGWATNRSSRDAMVLSLGAAGAEFTAQSGTSPSVLRHLGPVPPTGPGPMFLSELRRTASMVPAAPPFAKPLDPDAIQKAASDNGTVKTGDRELVVWNGFSLDKSARQAVGESLGMPVRAGDLATLGVCAVGSAIAAEPGHFAPAVALALSGLAEANKDGAVDFLHSRLSPAPKPLVDRRVIWAAAIGLLLLLLGLFALHEQHVDQADLDREIGKYSAMEPSYHAAAREVAKIEYAHRWQGGVPRYIACLRDLTYAMPDDGRTYLTSFDLHENMEGTLSGKSTSTNDNPVIAVENGMKASKCFKKVTASLTARETRNGREVTFTISFLYVGHD
jgi:hypothetical protein